MAEIGFYPSDADAGLFTRTASDGVEAILVQVDDMLIACHAGRGADIVRQLGQFFTITDLGEATFFLGLKIKRNRELRTITLSQKRYSTDVLERFGMSDCKPKPQPFSSGTKLSKAAGTPLDPELKLCFMEIIGSLMYLATCTRPDISHAVCTLARFMAAPTYLHLEHAKHVLRYIRSSSSQGITFGVPPGGAGAHSLLGFCDSDWGGDFETKRSTTGYVFILNGGAIAWQSKLQQTVAASTCEAEYMAASAAAKEALWLQKLMCAFEIPLQAVEIRTDNQSSLTLLNEPILHARSKHIDIHYPLSTIHYFVRDPAARARRAGVHYIPTADMVADTFTKALPLNAFRRCRNRMGLRA